MTRRSDFLVWTLSEKLDRIETKLDTISKRD